MKCPHCKKEIDYVLVLSQCCQRGRLESEDGKFYISEYNRLDVLDTQAIECPVCNVPLMHIVGQGVPLASGEGTHVDLTSSGYDWTCPACQHLNTVSEAPATWAVQCAQCDIKFLVNEVHH